MTLHIRVSERVAEALKRLADADHRKLAPYIGLVLERHVDAAEAAAEAKVETKPKGKRP